MMQGDTTNATLLADIFSTHRTLPVSALVDWFDGGDVLPQISDEFTQAGGVRVTFHQIKSDACVPRVDTHTGC